MSTDTRDQRAERPSLAGTVLQVGSVVLNLSVLSQTQLRKYERLLLRLVDAARYPNDYTLAVFVGPEVESGTAYVEEGAEVALYVNGRGLIAKTGMPLELFLDVLGINPPLSSTGPEVPEVQYHHFRPTGLAVSFFHKDVGQWWNDAGGNDRWDPPNFLPDEHRRRQQPRHEGQPSHPSKGRGRPFRSQRARTS